ncbi:hypothetical protein AV649_11675 [Rossellomorea marisflavi]|uniref:Nucleoside 2-deoxyribosyltransferase n=1 Tax=Rossellomorea marisflavi TaxID=189381 RepID=A0A161S114_9BACI|nr:hypothetical protein AV649_11675 [Rossellomorea marisflavi]
MFSDRPVEVQSDSHSVVTLKEILNAFPRNVSERIDRTLLNLVTTSNHPGDKIKVSMEIITLIFTKTGKIDEMEFLLSQLVSDKLVQGSPYVNGEITVSVKGWNRVAELQSQLNRKESDQAFIAMWFDPSMNSAADAIMRAINEAGYKAIRIDKKEHNNKIDDEIIAEIKKSKFVVADFTGHRGGVYFEAGFGMGLGKPVIWICREDSLGDLHFDTRQYSHIVWKNENELYTDLLNRIRATID